GVIRDDDHEALPVARDIVEVAQQAVWRTHVEERLNGVDVNAATLRSDSRGHPPVVERVIEQFLLVRPPARIAPARTRDLLLLARAGEGLDVDLQPAGLRRRVRDPAAIR